MSGEGKVNRNSFRQWFSNLGWELSKAWLKTRGCEIIKKIKHKQHKCSPTENIYIYNEKHTIIVVISKVL